MPTSHNWPIEVHGSYMDPSASKRRNIGRWLVRKQKFKSLAVGIPRRFWTHKWRIGQRSEWKMFTRCWSIIRCWYWSSRSKKSCQRIKSCKKQENSIFQEKRPVLFWERPVLLLFSTSDMNKRDRSSLEEGPVLLPWKSNQWPTLEKRTGPPWKGTGPSSSLCPFKHERDRSSLERNRSTFGFLWFSVIFF